MKRFVLSFVPLLILCSLLVSLPEINMVKAGGTIYIRSDGTVEGTDKIQRDGNVYTFTGDLFDSLVVERDNIVVDGAGYSLQGDGSGRGIDLYDDSTSITIRNMQIRNFHFGIHLSNSSYTIIESNYVANNFEGIRISGGFNNTIIGNTIANNNDNGIGVFFNTYHNLISRNKITNNWVGVLFHLYSASNTLSENCITANNGIGIWLDGGSNNRIIRNNVTDNTRGVFITATKNSIVYHNNFVNNTFHVDIYGNDPVISMWDNGSQGNHWDDYTGTDNDGDGIGDTPYVIDANNTDRYPLMKPAAIPPIVIPEIPDTTPPTISIVSPESKGYPANNVSLTFTVSEPTSWVGYSLDGQAIVKIAGNITLTGLSSGSHNLIVYAQDNAGNIGTSETNFTIAEPFPTLIIFALAIITVIGLTLLKLSLWFISQKSRKQQEKEMSVKVIDIIAEGKERESSTSCKEVK